MTELSFLIELLLNDELPKTLKVLVKDRIKEVESRLTAMPAPTIANNATVAWRPPPGQAVQSPSTLALMAKHGDLPQIVAPVMPPIEPVTQIAQTPATAAAMMARNESINQALSGKPDKGSKQPRKW